MELMWIRGHMMSMSNLVDGMIELCMVAAMLAIMSNLVACMAEVVASQKAGAPKLHMKVVLASIKVLMIMTHLHSHLIRIEEESPTPSMVHLHIIT